MATPEAHIRDWLKAIGVLKSGPPISPAEATVRIQAVAANLAKEFPPGAFTPESMRTVARACNYFPDFAEICHALSPWWRQHRPHVDELPAPEPYAPKLWTEEEKASASQTVREVTAALKHSEGERLAAYARTGDVKLAGSAFLSRAQLTEAYRRGGVKGPVVPAESFRAAAATVTPEVRRGLRVNDARRPTA